VGGIVVEHRVDRPAGRDLALRGVEKADEFAVAVVLNTSDNHCSVEPDERGEQSGGAVALVVVRQGLAAPGSIGSPGWCGRELGSGFSRRAKGPRHVSVDRHRGRQCC
jgi:hypothetical protein